MLTVIARSSRTAMTPRCKSIVAKATAKRGGTGPGNGEEQVQLNDRWAIANISHLAESPRKIVAMFLSVTTAVGNLGFKGEKHQAQRPAELVDRNDLASLHRGNVDTKIDNKRLLTFMKAGTSL